jgi:ABC-type Co2+ transport system permease subunit
MSYADREIVASGFTAAIMAILIGCVVQFTHQGALNHVLGYAVAACGMVLLFVCCLARGSRGYAALLRTLLMALAGLLLAGVLLRDALERLI